MTNPVTNLPIRKATLAVIVSLSLTFLLVSCGAQQAVVEDQPTASPASVSYTHLRAHDTSLPLVCRLLLEKK